MTLPILKLKRHQERRIRAGHIWIYSNEIDTDATPLSAFEAGDAVLIQDAKGHNLGTGYVNPHTLLCARLVSRDANFVLDKSLLVHRINIAMSLRKRYYDKPYYRLLYGDSDDTPGLIVDRFDDVLVAQINTAGMERVKDQIIEALVKTLKPKTIIFRNDTSARKTEGLSAENEVPHGTAPELLRLEENGVLFEVPAMEGQKTGWFYDHRGSRAHLQTLVKDKSVLDVFSYAGGWGVQAAAAGATDVTCIDSSEKAIDFVHHNAGLNQVDDKITSIHGDATAALQGLRDERKKYDIIVLDPPAFIKRKKDRSSGTTAYQRLNQKALQCLNRDGILISASCSFHLRREELMEILLKASRHVDRSLQIIGQGYQGPDHPIHPAIPETEYLKTFFARVNPV